MMNKLIFKMLILGVLNISSVYIYAQIKITGTVTDNLGETLPGVTVIVEGTMIGTVTDMEGQYDIEVTDEAAILRYSFVGYRTERTIVGTRSVIDITLNPDHRILDEVVVVGFGTRAKVNLTGAVSNVQFDENITSRSLSSASAALAGQVPGLSVRQGSGMPGRERTELLIRGLGTVNNANPLIVVDGMPDVDIDRIDVNDIESISVLKDAASASVYGSRAANGVILITTKSGSEKPVITYSGNTALSQPVRFYDFITDYPQTMLMHINASEGGNRAPAYRWGSLEEWMAKSLVDPVYYPSTDWYDVIFQDGLIQNHNVSASGSGNRYKFFMSGGISDQRGIVIRNNHTRINLRSNIEYKIRDYITLGTRIDGQWTETDYGIGDGIGGSAIRNTTPGITPIDPVTGQFGGAMAYGENRAAGNLLAAYTMDFNEDYRRGVNTSVFGVWKPIEELALRVDYGINFDNRFSRDWSMPHSTYNLQTGGVVDVRTSDNAGIDNSMNINYKTNLQARINYEKEIFSRHNLGVMFAFSEEYWNNRSLSAGRMDRLYPNILEVSAALPTTMRTGGYSSAEGLRAFIGRVNYDVLDKYLLEVSARYDGSSKFSPENRYGFFPSVSGAWRISEESFFYGLKDFMSYAKLRVSYGSLGNNSGVGRYEQKETFETTNYVLNNGVVRGFSYSKMIDPRFSWESTSIFNVGFDVSFLNDLVYAEFDYYDRLTTGMIRPSDLSDFLFGYQPPRVNVGNLRNRGFESNFLISKQLGEVFFSTNLNASYNFNRLEKWNEYLGPGNVFLNMPYQFVYGYDDYGIVQSWNDVYNGPYQSNYLSPGDLLLKDVNGDGSIGGSDRIAYPDKMQRRPTINGALSFTFRWKGINVVSLIQGAAGRFDWWGDNLSTTNVRDNRFNFSRFHWEDTWSYYNRGASMPRITVSGGDNGGRNTTSTAHWLQSKSYVRLKNLQIGYNLPSDLISRVKINRIRIYVTGENLYTVTNWMGIDPEKNSSDSDFYPLLRTFGLGTIVEL